MQNSVLKLISIAGVLGIGTLVVLEVHNRLPEPSPAPAVSEEENPLGESAEISRFPETEPSEFQLAMADNEPSFAASNPDSTQIDTDPFGSAFTEPDVGNSDSVDVRVDANTLTDGPSPFGTNQFSADEPRSSGESVPVRPVGYSEQPPATAAVGTEDVPDLSGEAFTLDAEEEQPVFSFDDAAPEPEPASTSDDLSLPTEENPFDIANFTADPEPADTTPAETTTPADRSREPNTLLFLSEDRTPVEDQPADGDDMDTGELDFGSPFEEDTVPVELEPDSELEFSLDESADESRLQPAPNLENESLAPLRDDSLDYRAPEPALEEPPAVTPTEFTDDLSRERMFDEIAGSDDAPLPFTESEVSQPEPATLEFDGGRDSTRRMDETPVRRFEPPRDRLAPEDTRPRLDSLDRTAPATDPRSLPDELDPPGRARVAPPQDRSRDINFDRTTPRTFRAQPDLSSDERRLDDPEVEIRPRGRDFDRRFDNSRRRNRNGVVPASASAPVSVLQPHLTVRKNMPASATLGVPLTYTLVVTNEGQAVAKNIIVEDSVPKSARVEDVNPPVEFLDGSRTLQWEFTELAAGETQRIQVRLVPEDQGILDTVATVRFKTEVKTKTVIQAPRLVLHVDVKSEVKLGNETQLRFLARNEGDGTARDVVLRSNLPAGLRHPIGDDLEYSIGTLEPNEEREIILNVVAAEPGNFTSKSEIIAEGSASGSAETKIQIVGQQIEILRQGPPKRYVNRSAVYSNILTNNTAFPASDIVVVETVPRGMKFEKASHNGAWNPEDGTVVWRLRELPSGETTTLKIELMARSAGQQESKVTVIENAGFKTAATHITAVEDINHMGARISGNDRPVAVGEVFSFDITAQNRGTTRATGVVLTMDLPPGIMGMSTGKEGPQARPYREGDRTLIRFDPVEIDPADEMIFRINLKATSRMTDAAVNARIRYDQTGKELVTTESVTAYFNGP